MSDYKELRKCLCCDNEDIRVVLDLGSQPLANSYHDNEQLTEYPLMLKLCQKCWHLQLSHAVNPDLMFKNYLYVSGTSNTLREYFEWFADFTLNYKNDSQNILDIACNDGSQLDAYKKRNLDTYGVDPAENLSQLSISKGHKIIVDYFNDGVVKSFDGKKFDLIVAQNVFAHNTYPSKFLKLCKNILSENGLIFIQTSQANMVVNNEFDTIYHEHISFFNPISMIALLEKTGLFIKDIVKTNIHGTSYVFVISKTNQRSKNVDKQLTDFNNKKLNKLITYSKYSYNAHKITYDLKYTVEKFRENGHYVVGYGAAAKGNTLLNFGKIKLDYIVDDNPMKCGLLTPGMNIEIKQPSFIGELKTDKPVVFIPLAWNFYFEIRKKIKGFRNVDEDVFVKYFPKLILEN